MHDVEDEAPSTTVPGAVRDGLDHARRRRNTPGTTAAVGIGLQAAVWSLVAHTASDAGLRWRAALDGGTADAALRGDLLYSVTFTYHFAGSTALIGLAVAAVAATRRRCRASWFGGSQALLLIPALGLFPVGTLCAIAFGAHLFLHRRAFGTRPPG